MKLADFNIEDHGDGSYTLTPKAGTGAETIQKFKRVRRRVEELTGYIEKATTQLATGTARLDELRAELVAAGIDPDSAETP